MKQKLSEEIRQTYILLYEKNNVRYIFNRSVRWDAIMNTKNIEHLIDVLGKDAINHFIIRMNDSIKKTTIDVNNLTKTFVYDDTVFYILEVHPEWENYGKKDQNEINERKKELCLMYNAVDRKDKITGEQGLELQISNIIKKEFKKWLVDIYSAISKYSHLIYDETVKTTLWLTKESLIDEIDKLRNERNKLEHQIKTEESELYKTINDNKKKLQRQNYVIDVYNKYINNLNDNEIQQLKNMLIKKGQYHE